MNTTTHESEHLGHLARTVLESSDDTLYGLIRHRARRSGAFVVDLFVHRGQLVNLRALAIHAGYPLHRYQPGVLVYEQGTDPVALVAHDVLALVAGLTDREGTPSSRAARSIGLSHRFAIRTL